MADSEEVMAKFNTSFLWNCTTRNHGIVVNEKGLDGRWQLRA